MCRCAATKGTVISVLNKTKTTGIMKVSEQPNRPVISSLIVQKVV
jgi:hypothetical protein